MRSSRCLLAALTLMACAIFAPVASAQPRIPQEVISASAALAPAQQQTLEEYARHWIGQLKEGSDEQVGQARSMLIDPFRQGAGDIFKRAYSIVLANQLTDAMTSDRPLVRMNAMIVASFVADPSIARLIQTGLKDQSPSVRYWAAKTISQIAGSANFSDEDKRALLGALVASIGSETSDPVLQQVLMGLGELDLAEATEQLLTGLNQRVAVHAQQPGVPVSAELEGIRKLFVRLVQARTQGRVPPSNIVRQLATVAYRYLTLSATLLDAKVVPAGAQSSYERMIENGDQVLRWALQQLAPDVHPPATFDAERQGKRWALVRLRAEEWKRALVAPPMNFPPAELDVPQPPAKTPATNP